MWSLSESVSSCSRMRLPSLSVKLRTQPTWSLRSLPSMRLSATTSCHWSWLLKSRSTAQTRSIGASITVERTTCWSTPLSPAEVALQASKPPWKTPSPIVSTSSRSRSSAHSNSALHSAKQRAPSVTGVSLSVAT